MKARLLRILLFLLSMAGPALADNRPNLGPPVEVPAGVGPLDTKTPSLGAPVATMEVVIPPPSLQPVKLAQFQRPVDAPPILPQSADRPNESPRLWVDGEALLWWMRSANLPPLITASPAGTARSDVGVLGTPGTAVLFGGPVNRRSWRRGVELARATGSTMSAPSRLEGYFFQLARPSPLTPAQSSPDYVRPALLQCRHRFARRRTRFRALPGLGQGRPCGPAHRPAASLAPAPWRVRISIVTAPGASTASSAIAFCR